MSNLDRWVMVYLNGRQWTSPTRIGQSYGDSVFGELMPRPCGYHSAWASPRCKRLVSSGMLERNNVGHYRAIQQPPMEQT